MDDIITLIKEQITGRDEYGNEIVTKTARDVMCQAYGVTRSEFYAAATNDLHPEWTVRLSDFVDYEGEKLAKFHGAVYSIIRVFRDSGSFHKGTGLEPNGIELILERKVGNTADETEES